MRLKTFAMGTRRIKCQSLGIIRRQYIQCDKGNGEGKINTGKRYILIIQKVYTNNTIINIYQYISIKHQ